MDEEAKKYKEHYNVNFKVIRISINKLIDNSKLLYSILCILFISSVGNFVILGQMQITSNVKLEELQSLNINKTNFNVDATIIKYSGCKECYDFVIALNEFRKLGVKINEPIFYEFDEAKLLIDKYKIDKVPALILSEKASNYKQITDFWQNIGTIESDGAFIVRNFNPTYYDLKSKNIKGLVDIVFIKDRTCIDCYDVMKNKLALEKLRIFIRSEVSVDVSDNEGKSLIKKYKIKKIPTFIMSKEAMDYPQFDTIWSSVGYVAEDGTLVFSNVESIGTYKDLIRNETVKI